MKLDPSKLTVLALFSAFLTAAILAIAGGVFETATGEPSRALALQLVGVVAFFVLTRSLPWLRRGVGAFDPVLLVSLQSWRILGMMFLFLMALGQLPAVFAIPAGVGDVLVGLAAPFVARRFRDGTLTRRGLAWFTGLGLLDFVAAFAFGNYVNLHPETYSEFLSMTSLPMVLVPGLFVPAFALLHLAAWDRGVTPAEEPAIPGRLGPSSEEAVRGHSGARVCAGRREA